VLSDRQVDVAALAVCRCLGIGKACGGIRSIMGSFGQGHAGSRDAGRKGANSEYADRGQPLAQLSSSARVTQKGRLVTGVAIGWQGSPLEESRSPGFGWDLMRHTRLVLTPYRSRWGASDA
jgi:hypothetical protein